MAGTNCSSMWQPVLRHGDLDTAIAPAEPGGLQVSELHSAIGTQHGELTILTSGQIKRRGHGRAFVHLRIDLGNVLGSFE